MLCPKCGRDNPDDSKFCNQCGERFLQFKGGGREGSFYSPVKMTGQTSQTSAAEEQEYWEGAFNWKAMINGGWLFILILMIALPIAVSKIEVLHNHQDLSFLSLVPIPFFLISLYIKQSVKYRITNERLTTTRGILSRESDDTQLIRIEDIRYYQALLNRIFNVGDVEIYSTDKNEPELVMEGIERPAEMKETLWRLIRERRKSMLYMEQLNK